MVALRVVFFGTPAFAVPTLRAIAASRHTLVGVVTQPDRRRGRGQKVSDAPVKACAVSLGVPVLQPERLTDPSVAATLAGWRPDIGVVAAYGKLIPPALLELPSLGMINVHASLLPRYRGAAPVQRAVIDGAAETGVTIMRVTPLLDAGPTFAALVRPIAPGDTSDEVEHDLAEMGAKLLLDVLDAIAGNRAREQPQDDMLSTYAPRLTKAEGLLDWSLPASFVHNRVRGLRPWPHAFTYLRDQRLIVLKTHVEYLSGRPAETPPGTIVDVSDGLLHVATGHGGQLAISLLQPEGGRPMTAREFLAGRGVRPGERFTPP